jgi:tetratricopeptide (TPR) repeat protein
MPSPTGPDERKVLQPNEISEGGDDKPPEGAERPRFNLEVMSEGAAEALTKLKGNVQYWVDRGRYNKVRIKRGGKAVLPDIPVGALVAFEAATFFWTGLLRGALVNTVGRVLFEVELINEAEEHYKRGLEHFLSGDLVDAEDCLQRCLRIDDRYARAHLQLGVLRKVQGRNAEAISHFEKCVAIDPMSDGGREAEVHLKKLKTL